MGRTTAIDIDFSLTEDLEKFGINCSSSNPFLYPGNLQPKRMADIQK